MIQGCTQTEVVSKFKVAYKTVTKYTKDLNIDWAYRRKEIFLKKRAIPAETIEAIKSMYVDGVSFVKIMKSLKVCKRTIDKHIVGLSKKTKEITKIKENNVTVSTVPSRREPVMKRFGKHIPSSKKLFLSICHDYFNLEMTEKQVAEKYGVCLATVHRYKKLYRKQNKI